MSEVKKIAVLILEKSHRYLVEKRKDDLPVDPSVVGFPGGHVEAGEEPLQALLREAREELGIELKDPAFIKTEYFTGPQEKQQLFWFKCTRFSGQLKKKTAATLTWITKEEGSLLSFEVSRQILAEV